ncbi:PREDICTED: uncharacterized protein LOC104801546 [Tarenaya hassleriana]|uniref:uncharacterized protein LOC104801546 n=1 Tax=Tarenaya hassleriana TaxID=28532 RepID=UPI00053C315A|nr:PREDICTED: uncharacterized protein LOC104801546 [Tarenaya hassleriana]
MEGEVRRVNVVYFLSRSGHVEHPHLLRVHHRSPNGVFLRDVKRWLGDARGNAMPDSFSWSYKRRYKNGYVWQDLLDDDLITPISDNEYVLKGSEILHASPKEHSLTVGKKAWGPRNGDGADESHQTSTTESSRRSTSGICKESPIFGSQRSSAGTTVTDESITNEEETSVLRTKNLQKSDDFHQCGGKNATDGDGSTGRPSVSSSKSSASYRRSKSYSSGASLQVLRSLMTCGGLDINDTVLMPLNRFSKAPPPCSGWEEDEDRRHYQQQQHYSRKSFDGAWNGLKMKEKIEFCRPKSAMAPICSQCGKTFKPEKMHSHMRLCRGMKNSAKNVSPSGNTKTAPVRPQGISPENVSAGRYVLSARD